MLDKTVLVAEVALEGQGKAITSFKVGLVEVFILLLGQEILHKLPGAPSPPGLALLAPLDQGVQPVQRGVLETQAKHLQG